MPGKLRVRIVAARELPVMDRASDLADAFAEVRFGQSTYKTDVYPKSLNPQWNSEWFKFEVDDEELQDEPLQIRVMDHDTYSAHDAIGKVYIDLNPLLWKDSVSDIAGWLPIYDTMHGIRGEIYIIVKVDLIEDVNRFRQSSVGVHFFNSSTMPSGYIVTAIHGFVEELVVNDDPEHQWIDMIRSPRASNEARQRLFSKLSGELQRKIGLKVLESEGNAVLGYWQCFDLEGESGVVVRGIGTMATIQTAKLPPPPPTSPPKDGPRDVNPLDDQMQTDGQPGYGSPAVTMNVAKQAALPPSPTKNVPTPRYASDSDLTGQAQLPKIVIDTDGVPTQEVSSQNDLVTIIPRLHDDLLNNKTDTLSSYKVPYSFQVEKPEKLRSVRSHSLAEPHTSGTTKVVTGLIQDMIQGICFKLRKLTPCCLSKMDIEFALDEDEIIQIWLTAAVVGMKPIVAAAIAPQKGPVKPSADSEMMFSMEEVSETTASSTLTKAGASSGAEPMQLERRIHLASNKPWRPEVLITPLAIIPGAIIDRYLGNLNVFFIRETTSVRESGGVSGFMRSFIAEVKAIVRRHVAALGGNALVAYALIDCIMEESPHKNQCQCLIHVCGDAVHIQYEDSSINLDGSSGKNSPHIVTAAPATRS
nr:C2 domain-containing protein 5-like [Lytechinus pictus]